MSILVLALIALPFTALQARGWWAYRSYPRPVAVEEVLNATELILTIEYHRYLSEGWRGFKPLYPPYHAGAGDFGPEVP